MTMWDPEQEQADLRIRLRAAVDALKAKRMTNDRIGVVADRTWPTLHRWLAGGRIDPPVVAQLELAVAEIQGKRAPPPLIGGGANFTSGVRMVPVVGDTGQSGQFRPLGEITLPDDALDRGTEYAAIRITDDDDTLVLRAGEVLVYEVGVQPLPGQVAVIDDGGRPVLERRAGGSGRVAVGTGRQVVTVRTL